MSRVWYCATCGYEVDRGGRCHNCRMPLVESPLAELADGEVADEVGYRLDEWEDEDRVELIEALIDAEVRHRFEGDELVVSAADEADVDDLVAEVSAALAQADGDGAGAGRAGAGGGDDNEIDPAVVGMVAALYDGARRLREDPTDMAADGDVAEVAARVFALDEATGIDPDWWASIGRVTRRLLGALGADMALEEEIATEAAILCRLLEPVLAPAEVDDEGGSLAGAAALGAGPDEAVTGADEAVAGADGALAGAEPDGEDEADEAAAEDEGEDEAAGEDEAGDRHEVVYDLADWLLEDRARLGLMLEREGIAYSWEDTDVVVADADWARLDQLCAQIVPPSDDDEDDDGEEVYRALTELFGTADRLSGAADDKGKRKAARDAAEVVTNGPMPIGMSDDQWWQIRARVKTLCESIDEVLPAEVVRVNASSLRELLRGFV